MNSDKKKAQKNALKLKSFIKKNSIEEHFVSIKLEESVTTEELFLFERFKKENVEIYTLIRDIVATVSCDEPSEIGLLEHEKGFFVTYGDQCIYFTLIELSNMLENHKLFKKAYNIYSSLLKVKGFNCLIMQ